MVTIVEVLVCTNDDGCGRVDEREAVAPEYLVVEDMVVHQNGTLLVV